MNPDGWPNADLKPSLGSLKGQRYVGPGGEKKPNSGELTVKVRTEQHDGRRHLRSGCIPRDQGPQALACGVESG